MWWLAAIGLLGIVITSIIRLTDDDTDYIVPASEIESEELSGKYTHENT